MTLSSRAQAFSVANLLRSATQSHATTLEIRVTSSREDSFLDIPDAVDGGREDDDGDSERTASSVVGEVKREDDADYEEEEEYGRRSVQQDDGGESLCTRHRHHQHQRTPTGGDFLGTVTSCFCHGDMALCIHPAVMSVPDDASQCANPITIELLHADLWSSFHRLGTEMIITKSGRRMFPAIKLRVNGLNPGKQYMTRLDFVQPDSSKYRYIYSSSRWMVAGTGDTMATVTSHVTPESPITGHAINSQVLSFERLKLTNSEQTKAGQVSLVSMQKFQPRIVIQEVDSEDVEREECYSIVFPQTSFMAVTAYQNQNITTLKIASNPFAKGFRESGKMRYPDHMMSQAPHSYMSGVSPRMPFHPSFIPSHSFSPFVPSGEASLINRKRPYTPSLASHFVDKQAKKVPRTTEPKHECAPSTVFFASHSQAVLNSVHASLSNRSLPLHDGHHFLGQSSPYLISPYIAYNRHDVKEAYNNILQQGRSQTTDRYHTNTAAVTAPSHSPFLSATTAVAASAATTTIPQRPKYDSLALSSDFSLNKLTVNSLNGRVLLDSRLAAATTANHIHNTSINVVGKPDSLPSSTSTQSRPSSSSSTNSLPQDGIPSSSNHTNILQSLRVGNELLSHIEDRHYLSHLQYCNSIFSVPSSLYESKEQITPDITRRLPTVSPDLVPVLPHLSPNFLGKGVTSPCPISQHDVYPHFDNDVNRF